jgi:hypothetical protein
MVREVESPYFSSDQLHDATAEEARRCLERHLGKPSRWTPLIRQLLESDFHEDYQLEAGHWLLTAERFGYADKVVRGVSRADQPEQAADSMFLVFFQEMAQAMTAYYFLSRPCGFGYDAWDPGGSGEAVGVDVDLRLTTPTGAQLKIQVKAPDRHGQVVGYRLVGGEFDQRIAAAVTKAAQQLPRPGKCPSLIVVVPNRTRPPEPEVLEAFVGETTNYRLLGGGFQLDAANRGPFFTDAWRHVGGIALLFHIRGVTEFRYRCDVLLNPNADSEARCEPSWFPGARVLYLEGDTFRWRGGAPPRSSFGEATRLEIGPSHLPPPQD